MSTLSGTDTEEEETAHRRRASYAVKSPLCGIVRKGSEETFHTPAEETPSQYRSTHVKGSSGGVMTLGTGPIQRTAWKIELTKPTPVRQDGAVRPSPFLPRTKLFRSPPGPAAAPARQQPIQHPGEKERTGVEVEVEAYKDKRPIPSPARRRGTLGTLGQKIEPGGGTTCRGGHNLPAGATGDAGGSRGAKEPGRIIGQDVPRVCALE